MIDDVPLNHKLWQRTQESTGAASADIFYIRGNLIMIHYYYDSF